MKQVYFRIFLSLIWFVVGVVSAVRGSFQMGVFYAIIGLVFLYSAYSAKKNTGDN